MAAVVTCLFGLLYLAMAALSVTVFRVARSTADADYDLAMESAAGWVWVAAFIVQALLAFVVTFGWVGRHGPARERLVRAGVRVACGVLVVTLIGIAAIVAAGLSDDAFRGSTITMCVFLGLTIIMGVGATAFTASALPDRTRTRLAPARGR